jgi:hypothetical protein
MEREKEVPAPQPGTTPAQPETPEEVEVDTGGDDDSDEGDVDE